MRRWLAYLWWELIRKSWLIIISNPPSAKKETNVPSQTCWVAGNVWCLKVKSFLCSCFSLGLKSVFCFVFPPLSWVCIHQCTAMSCNRQFEPSTKAVILFTLTQKQVQVHSKILFFWIGADLPPSLPPLLSVMSLGFHLWNSVSENLHNYSTHCCPGCYYWGANSCHYPSLLNELITSLFTNETPCCISAWSTAPCIIFSGFLLTLCADCHRPTQSHRDVPDSHHLPSEDA